MNNDQNLVNNEDNEEIRTKNYPLAISESNNICSSDSYTACGDCSSLVPIKSGWLCWGGIGTGWAWFDLSGE